MWSTYRHLRRSRNKKDLSKHDERALQINSNSHDTVFRNNKIYNWIYTNNDNFECSCGNCILKTMSNINRILIHRYNDFQELSSIKKYMLSICNSTPINILPNHVIIIIIDYIYSDGCPLTQQSKLYTTIKLDYKNVSCNSQDIYSQGNIVQVKKPIPLDLSIYTKKQLDIFNFIKNIIIKNIIYFAYDFAKNKQKEHFKEKKDKKKRKTRAYKNRKKKRESLK